MPSLELLCTQKVRVDEGTLENTVSIYTVSAEKESKLDLDEENESSSLQEVSITTDMMVDKKNIIRFIINKTDCPCIYCMNDWQQGKVVTRKTPEHTLTYTRERFNKSIKLSSLPI